jgi:serine/threonine protein kinase
MEKAFEEKLNLQQTGVLFVNSINKVRDEQGNSIIHGGAGAKYKITSKKSLLASGSLCKIKLCKNVDDAIDKGKSEYFAIKRFNKLTLRKHKQYLRRPDGMGMLIWTQLDAVRKEIDIMKLVNHNNCIQLYEVIEDVPKKDDEGNDISDDELSEKIYLVMELARHKEVMTWNLNDYKFVPNPCLI